jgi:uncharacterized membrane protein
MLQVGCKLFLAFTLFGFVGWVVETLLYILRDRKVVKRGFLFGPICPIYGVGALIGTIIMNTGVTNIFWIFYIGMILCGVLEYITHFVMEKAFSAVWWDYRDRMFNINGRVYLKGLLFFGAGMVVLVKYFLPPVYHVMDLMPDWTLGLLTYILYTILLVDITSTIADLKGTVKSLKLIINSSITKGQEGLDKISSTISPKVGKAKDIINELETLTGGRKEHKILDRIKQNFPDFDLKKYKEELAWYFGPESDTKCKEGIELHGDGNIKIDDDMKEDKEKESIETKESENK